jgi:hypothetical protein
VATLTPRAQAGKTNRCSPAMAEFYHNTIEKTREKSGKTQKKFLKKFLKPLDRFAVML